MRILHVTPFMGEQFGGSERYAYNLAKEQVKLGHQVELFTSRIKRETPLKSEFKGIQIRRFYTPKVIWNINPLNFMLHTLLRADHDIVHVHSYLYFSSNQAILAKILRSLVQRRTPLLLHIHGGIGNPNNLLKSPLLRIGKKVYDALIGGIMMRAADYILSADEYHGKAAVQLFNIPKGKYCVMHNGINFSKFARYTNNNGHSNREILYVGDLEQWKGVETLVKALYYLDSKGENFKLKFVGQGSLRHKLEATADGLDIEFLGQIPHSEMGKVMSEAFAVVLPSLWEGIPTVGLEAMATRTPFIGTNVGGIPEIVKNNITGLLVPQNNPVELAEAILRLFDVELRRQLTQNAFQLIKKKFDITRITERIVKLYERILCS